jgi:hypothetical protein
VSKDVMKAPPELGRLTGIPCGEVRDDSQAVDVRDNGCEGHYTTFAAVEVRGVRETPTDQEVCDRIH